MRREAEEESTLTENRRGMAALVGKDVNKLKSGGRGKWKYMSEKDMLEISEKFRPYRYVSSGWLSFPAIWRRIKTSGRQKWICDDEC